MKSAVKKQGSGRWWGLCLGIIAGCMAWAGPVCGAALSADGDFGLQTGGSNLGTPWSSGGLGGTVKPVCSADSQSPFTNLFAANAKGAYWVTNSSGPFFIQNITEITTNTPVVYMNADVMLPTSVAGGFRLFVSNAGGGAAVAVVKVKSTGIYAQDGTGDGAALCSVVTGEWYNVQLTLNMLNKTYSGAVIRASTSERRLVSSRSFVTATNVITAIGSDTTVANAGCAVDNWVLSDTPLASPAYVDTGHISLDGDFAAQTAGSTLVTPWNSLTGGTPAPSARAEAQSPFTNVFASNGKGGYLDPAATGNPYFLQNFVSVSTASASKVYMNADVMLPTNSTGTGGVRLMVSQAGGGSPSALVRVRTTGIFADSTNGVGRAVCGVERGKWYNIQLTLDLLANVYSGRVINAATLERAEITSRALITSNAAITTIGTDVDTLAGGCKGGCFDNWVLGDTPMAAPESVDYGRLTRDGDFGSQSDGLTLRAPWTDLLGSTPTGSTNAQSPFVNAFPANGIGAEWSSSLSGPYFGQLLVPDVPSNSTGKLYMNVDFQLPTSASGGYRLVLGGATSVLEFYVNSAGLYARSPVGKGTLLAVPEVGVWYNLQLTLDLDSATYSGTIAREGTLARTDITSRSFMNDIDMTTIFADTAGAASVSLPQANVGIRVDNWVVSNQPTRSPIPRGTAVIIK